MPTSLWIPNDDDHVYAEDRLCWASKTSELSGDPTPCNERGIPPLYLCIEHDVEIRPVEEPSGSR